MSAAGGTIAPEKILRELTDLWADLSHGGPETDSAKDGGVLRACSMTLLTMTEEKDDMVNLGETIAALMPQHPARTIVIRLSSAEERMLSERVYAQCWMPFGRRRQICCEQVEITATDDALTDLPPVILPLAVADLPLVLWCRSPRMLFTPEFGPLAAMADKIVLDSAEIRSLWMFGGRAIDSSARVALHEMSRMADSGAVLGDLAWTRLTRWREGVAQIFESRANRDELNEIAQVTVTTNGEPGVSAFYLGAWVMDCLRKAGVTPRFRLERGGSSPLALRITGTNFEAELEVQDDRLASKVNGLSNCAKMTGSTEYALMNEELAVMRRDKVFETSLETAARLAAGVRQ